MIDLSIGTLLVLGAALGGSAIAFGVTTVLLRRLLREIGSLPDLNKRLRAREVQLSMMRTTAEQRRDRIRLLLAELEQQSGELLACRSTENLAIEELAGLEERSPESIRCELNRRVEHLNGVRIHAELSSNESILRKLEMIRNCREELEIATDSGSLPYPEQRPEDAIEVESVPG